MTCRYFGISRQAYYQMYCRYQADGVEGLRTRPKKPHSSPDATHPEVVGKIIYPRQNYRFGPEKIAMYLKRYHDSPSAPLASGSSCTASAWPTACLPAP